MFNNIETWERQKTHVQYVSYKVLDEQRYIQIRIYKN